MPEVSNGALPVEGQQRKPPGLHGLDPENARLTIWRPELPQGPLPRTIGAGENYGTLPVNATQIGNTMPPIGHNSQFPWVSLFGNQNFWTLVLISYLNSHRDRVCKLLPQPTPIL